MVLCAFSPTPSWAQVTPPVRPVVAREATQNMPAAQFVQNLGNEALRVIKDKNLSEDQRNAKYHELLRNAFDMRTIAHFVIGRAWNSASDEQVQEYLRLFEAIVIDMYGDRLDMYSGESFSVTGARAESEKDFIVNSKVEQPGGSKATNVDWRVRQKNGRFAVVDVIIGGISQSVTQREEYMSIIQRDNGKLDGLLAVMRQRLQDMSGEIIATPASSAEVKG